MGQTEERISEKQIERIVTWAISEVVKGDLRAHGALDQLRMLNKALRFGLLIACAWPNLAEQSVRSVHGWVVAPDEYLSRIKAECEQALVAHGWN